LKLRTLIIAGVIGIELLGAFAYVRWRQYVFVMVGAGTETKNGVVYELPRTDETLGYHTQFFDKKQFETGDHGQKRVMTYYWMEPDRPYLPDQKFPLVMVLHGAPGRAYAAQYLKVPDMKRDFPAFIFVPTIPISRVWAAPDEVDGVKTPAIYTDHQSLPGTIEIIRRLIHEYPIDPARIYVMGCSDGASGAYGAALRYPDIFAAAVPMSGGWNIADAAQMTQVPMWIFHGALDRVFPVSVARAMAASIKSHGGDVRYTEFPDMGHNCPSPSLYARETWQWLFNQKKPNP
jgi:predicted peptidase